MPEVQQLVGESRVFGLQLRPAAIQKRWIRSARIGNTRFDNRPVPNSTRTAQHLTAVHRQLDAQFAHDQLIIQRTQVLQINTSCIGLHQMKCIALAEANQKEGIVAGFDPQVHLCAKLDFHIG